MSTQFDSITFQSQMAGLDTMMKQIQEDRIRHEREREEKEKREKELRQNCCIDTIYECTEILCKGDCCLYVYKNEKSCWNHPCCCPCECVHGILCCPFACCCGALSACEKRCRSKKKEQAAPEPQTMV
jgi:hypothetical protein